MFDPKQFRMTGATLDGSCQSWAYDTADLMAVVTAPDYFVGVKSLGVRLGDKIYIRVLNNVANPTSVVAHGYRAVSGFDALTGRNATAALALS